jgi:hypothetical protein
MAFIVSNYDVPTTAPVSFETSLTEAENTCFSHLCFATNTNAGTTAFIGRSNGGVDNFFFEFTIPETTDAPFWNWENLSLLSWQARAEATFIDRGNIQQWIMSIIKWAPFYCRNNVREFKVLDIGAVTSQLVELPNEARPWMVFKCVIEFICIFETGGKLDESSSEDEPLQP